MVEQYQHRRLLRYLVIKWVRTKQCGKKLFVRLISTEMVKLISKNSNKWLDALLKFKMILKK